MADKTHWTWNHTHDGRDGVNIEGAHLVWWSENWAAPFASGGACEQSFGDFLESGPVDAAMPQADLQELREIIRTRLKLV